MRILWVMLVFYSNPGPNGVMRDAHLDGFAVFDSESECRTAMPRVFQVWRETTKTAGRMMFNVTCIPTYGELHE